MSNHDNKHDSKSEERGFDEYLRRGSSLSQNYHQLEQELVPAELDQKILTLARDAVVNSPESKDAGSTSSVSRSKNDNVVTHPSWWTKWNKPMALAASLMLAFTVIYQIGRQPIEELANQEIPTKIDQGAPPASQTPTLQRGVIKEEAPKVADEPALAGLSKKVDVGSNRQKSTSANPPRAESEVVVRLNPIVAPAVATPDVAAVQAPAAALEDKAPAKSIVGATAAGNTTSQTVSREPVGVVDSITAEDIGKLPDRNTSESLQRIPGIKIDHEAAPAMEKKLAQKSGPEAALQHIRELRKQGKTKQADEEWKQFQKDFPYYEVPADDPARGKI